MEPDYGNVVRYDTFPKLLLHNAEVWPGEVAMREKEFGVWNEFTWSDYRDRVREIALGLLALGVKRGEVVGFIGKNRPEMVWSELAAHAIGCMSLGIYHDAMPQEVAYLVDYAEVRVVLAEDEEQVDKLLEVAENSKSIEKIVYFDARGMRKYSDDRLLGWEELRTMAAKLDAHEPGRFAEEVEKGSGQDVAILCTTSGTTSHPKLAMLQAGPFLGHCAAYLKVDEKLPTDNYVSVLPLPWIMEQIYAVAQPLISRITVNFVEEPETMMADLREIGPTFVLLAPRVWEQIAADVHSRMMDATRFKRKMFDLGMRLGLEALAKGRRSKLAELILFRPLRDRLGFSFLKSAATGGAALGPETFRFFQAMGVPLRQIYGQTELAGAYTIHRMGDVDFDTVGLPFGDTELRIDQPDPNGVGEIVARTAGMFLGFYRNDEATRADVRDGWMYTGDAGYFKPGSGHLVVIDRVKDLAVTSTGTRFSPQFIENKLKFSPFIAEAVILGNARPYLAAIVCIRYSIVSKWAEQRGIAFTNYTSLSSQPEVYRLLRQEFEKVNATLPEAQRVHKFVLLYKELDADDGELTRTRKVRRNVIAEKYADIIDAIYSDTPVVHVDTVIRFQDGTISRIQTDLVLEKLLEAGPAAGQPARQPQHAGAKE
ncbi:long-chain fatty acid--CoA ligase [Quisquiliibacterium transsilvanicum]|uniref:Long-chain acyl-CoA synthetase n=1 Tax=Quisquiliibacterium transsilvanicum TaxID=1549638 RepID=A0A7W8HJU8_9BURK|nr:long-chain fatty acid--CoA ligase [Quisquiliibacterium transsilvanicum]MBB5273391.1 long-chain acyl-CoA synthetase [Quisquiliibacterium transsilvanicum]